MTSFSDDIFSLARNLDIPMSTLFTSPMDCGPVNDLKRLGGRVDIDNSRLYDRTVGGNASASGSRPQATQVSRSEDLRKSLKPC